ncbi:MAG: aldehyde dehydrogenase [Candidatus Hodarchaeota archaeon]
MNPTENGTIRSAVSRLDFRTQAFIDGKFADAACGKTFVAENPALGKPLANIAACDKEDVDRAVKAARSAFEKGSWSKMPPEDRKNVLFKFADLLETHTDELALLECLEAGKPIQDCRTFDIPETVKCIRWHAEAIDKLYDHVSPTSSDTLSLILREPIGVVGAVIPWNFPALMAAWKIGPALAAGNSVLLKPSELSSLSALRMGELAAEAGVPQGVFNVLPGLGETAGQAIGLHMDIDMLAFTGSTEVGHLCLSYAAKSNLKRIILECGGKSPQVVMADATDIDRIAENVLTGAFWNMGENCSCGSRLIVHESLKDPLLDRLIELCKEWPIGDPLNPETKVGPMIEKAHMEKVLGYIDAGNSEGAHLALGGRRVLEETGGYFIEPTIFDKVNNDMKIAREEIFGPVLSVITFTSEDQAISIANDSNYGLAASVYTQDVNAAHRISRALKAGTVSINCFSEGDMTTPFGGYKESGFFGRDKSIWAHEQYTQLKTIWMQLD